MSDPWVVDPIAHIGRLHGDAHECDVDSFYCWYCASFEPTSHFTRNRHNATMQELFERSLGIHRVWEALGFSQPRTGGFSALQVPWATVELLGRKPST